jgi:hypothetical protein
VGLGSDKCLLTIVATMVSSAELWYRSSHCMPHQIGCCCTGPQRHMWCAVCQMHCDMQTLSFQEHNFCLMVTAINCILFSEEVEWSLQQDAVFMTASRSSVCSSVDSCQHATVHLWMSGDTIEIWVFTAFYLFPASTCSRQTVLTHTSFGFHNVPWHMTCTCRSTWYDDNLAIDVLWLAAHCTLDCKLPLWTLALFIAL